ncbi:MAG: undecaprenyldiphospho-muramoylpentapeptide beta-N-acetylglucosaminyltransferase [Bacteroidales bacterium]|nr:undecaprenyldiphospho-muramoylpentapeptide beta-N-acetylglucosaminyltransferase [Bacteroidales bacterium]
MKKLRVIISGGGTGGHIFPALAIAGELRELNPETEVLFVGAEGRMEMEKVPAAGYEIVGLPVAGLQRKLALSNLALPFKFLKSVSKAGRIIDKFKPDIAIGVGGYASAPLLWKAERKGIPTLIQEQNGFAGLANRMLGKKAGCICVAYEGMERFFPAERIVMTGNPIRSIIVPPTEEMRREAYEYYGLHEGRRQILVTGGSLGSRTLNEAVKGWIVEGCPGGENAEILWQCGKWYKADADAFMAQYGNATAENPDWDVHENVVKYVHHTDFIGRMDLAYAAADVVISRSGASTVSELCAAHKAVVFVPSPNVTEDHQTHNAMALVSRNAALIVPDAEAGEKLMTTAVGLLNDAKRTAELEKNIAALARTDASFRIAEQVYKLVENK